MAVTPLLRDCQFKLLSFHQIFYSSAHIWSVQNPFISSRQLLLWSKMASSDSFPSTKAATSLLTDCQFRLLSFHQSYYFSAHRLSVQAPFLSSRQLLLCSQIVSSDSFPFIKAVTSLLTDSQFRLLSFHQESYFSAHRLSVQAPVLSS